MDAVFLGKTTLMASSIADKLRIKKGFSLLVINKPLDFEKSLGQLPDDVSIIAKGKQFDQVHWFVQGKSEMENQLDTILHLLKEGIVCWTYYPKVSSKIQTDLTRDKGWDELLKHDELTWISLVSFDTTWSVFGFRLKTDADRKKAGKPKEKPVLDYIDTVSRTITLPDDLKAALAKHKSAQSFFHSLSFTNRKEYVEWIVSAKRAETRTDRVKKTIEKLDNNLKNPSDKG
jgi:hypothetical protein